MVRNVSYLLVCYFSFKNLSCSFIAVNGSFVSKSADVLIDPSTKFSQSEDSLIFKSDIFSGKRSDVSKLMADIFFTN